MIDLGDLSKGQAAAPIAGPTALPALAALRDLALVALAPPEPPAGDAPKDETPAQKSAPIQTPPGLPLAYVEMNLQDQPVPQPPTEEMAQEQKKPLGHELTPGVATMCHRECISYRPGTEVRLTQERIDQGPHVFVSRAQRDAHDRGQHEEEESRAPQGPTLAHPNTLRAGTYIKGESAPYRPGV
jgi:hypothetical protein